MAPLAIRVAEINQGIAITALWLVPPTLAVLGRRQRSALYVSAAVMFLVVSPLLWTAMPIALAIGIALLWAFARTDRTRPRLGWAVAVVTPILLTAAGAALVAFSRTERCGFDGDDFVCRAVAPLTAVVASTLLAVAAVASGWLLAEPRDHREPARTA